MVNFSPVKLINRWLVERVAAIYRLETIAFIFTGRTAVRLGGFNVYI
ncbi:MAG: hypothetical protein IMY88_01625 [Chloroflexi bacterium]|nr:hypothetical protein [Chloroflexota bacterium]